MEGGRFTPRVRSVIELATAEADSFGHSYVGTGHLLLALLHQRDSVAGQLLERLGIAIDPGAVAAALTDLITPAHGSLSAAYVPRPGTTTT